MLIAENFKLIRQSLGLTQAVLANILEITTGMVKSYESGRAEPKKVVLDKLGVLVNISPKRIKEETLSYDALSINVKKVDLIGKIFELRNLRDELRDAENDRGLLMDFIRDTGAPGVSAQSVINGLRDAYNLLKFELLTYFQHEEKLLALVDSDFFSIAEAVQYELNREQQLFSVSQDEVQEDKIEPGQDIPSIVIKSISVLVKGQDVVRKYNELLSEIKQADISDAPKLQISLRRTTDRVMKATEKLIECGIVVQDPSEISEKSIERIVAMATRNKVSFFAKQETDIEEVRAIYETELQEKRNDIGHYIREIYKLKVELFKTKNSAINK
jgi:transcriptional regulator with XRE-family HTH domain